MSKYAITSGTIAAPVKTVLYGPEGIGKSTFAAQFPAPVFIDTEGGTKRLNVARLPAPTSWAICACEMPRRARCAAKPSALKRSARRGASSSAGGVGCTVFNVF